MIVKNTDIEARLKSLLLYQFKDLPNFAGLIKGFSISGQDIENEIYRFLNELSLSDAIGKQLDGIGEILGELRAGRDDASYRAALGVTISINTSFGEPERMINVLLSITDSTFVRLTETYPASIEMFFNGQTVPPNLLFNMARLTPAGVGLSITGNSSTNPFIFDLDPDGSGFNEAGQNVGGEFSEVYKA